MNSDARTIPGGGSTPVQVTFDSTGLATGTYNANLCAFSDDPDPGPGNGTNLVVVPVTLDVYSGEGPSIDLTKTVGTVPGVCAGTDTITVATGTDVYYCYHVENTGTVTFNFHDLEDDQLGTLLDDDPYVLAPGAVREVIVPETVTAPVVNVATWTAVDAIGGYAMDDTIPYNWEDISTSGTPITLTDDSLAQFPIGFSFDFYGTAYTDFWVSSNGFLSATGDSNGCCSGQALPNTSIPNGVIAGWWEDMNPSLGGTVHYQTLGSAPNRYAIVQFTNIQHYGGGNAQTVQYKLYEGSNVIEVHYQAAPSDGGTHSAGIENQDGTVGLQFYYGTVGLTTPEAVRYTPTETVEATDTDTASVLVSDPDITVNPSSLASSQMTNTVVTLPLTIGNIGVADLLWQIFEEGSIFEGGTPSGSSAPPPEAPQALAAAGAYAHGMEAVAPMSRGVEALINDGSFENGPPPASAWTEVTNSTCEWIGDWSGVWGVAAYDGVFDFWAGGYCSGVPTTSSVEQQIPVPTAGATLSFWYLSYRPDADDSQLDYAYVQVDGTTVWTLDLIQANNTFPNWVNTTVDLSAYAGQNVTLKLGAVSAGTETGNIRFDYLEFTFCQTPSDVPWLSAAPLNGTTLPGGTNPVDVTFDSTGIAVGTYNAMLCVLSNDPDEPIVPVPVQMEVVIPVELMGISIE